MAEPTAQGHRWAVLIGADDYHESLGPLRYATADCHLLATTMTTGGDAIHPDRLLLLTGDAPPDRRPTYTNIHSWLASWLAQAGENDSVTVFFAGHGRAMNGSGYLAPTDATLDTLHVTGIPIAFVQELLGRCKARQKLLILDACHSGAGRDVAPMPAPVIDELARGRGMVTLTSCSADEISHEWDEKGHGVFTYYLAEALGGGCPPDGQGRLTADAVYEWVHDRVRQWAARHRCRQTPCRLTEGAGALTLRHMKTDWEAVARDLQRRLDETRRTLDALAGQTAQAPPPAERAAGAAVAIKTIVVPDDTAVRYYLDDEPADHAVAAGGWPPERKELKVVPRSRKYGVARIAIGPEARSAGRLVVKLPGVFHGRALGASLAIALFTLITLWVSLLFPHLPFTGHQAHEGTLQTGLATLVVYIIGVKTILNGVRSISIGWSYPMLACAAPFVAMLPLWKGGSLTMGPFFAVWLAVSCILCMVSFCLVPWPEPYYGTRF